MTDPMPWLSDLEPKEREWLTDELSSALLHYYWNDPIDYVLAGVAKVLAKWEAEAADPNRIRPGAVVDLSPEARRQVDRDTCEGIAAATEAAGGEDR